MLKFGNGHYNVSKMKDLLHNCPGNNRNKKKFQSAMLEIRDGMHSTADLSFLLPECERTLTYGERFETFTVHDFSLRLR
jgi:hypothetical protein